MKASKLEKAAIFFPAVLLATAALAASPPSQGVPLANGRYRVVGVIMQCPNERLLCARLGSGKAEEPAARDELTLTLAPSRWDASLRSILGLRVTMRGCIESIAASMKTGPLRLTLESAPRVFRESVGEAAVPTAPIQRLGD